MRTLIVYANPKKTGLCAALHDAVLRAVDGHAVDDVDLYEQDFDPVKSPEEMVPPKPGGPRPPLPPEVARHVDLLKQAEALVLVYPVWHFGFPAILKGYIDRICLPGIAYRFENGRMKGNLEKLKVVAAVATYGAPRIGAWWYGDPTRRFVTRQLAPMAANPPEVLYLARYGAARTSEAAGRAFAEHVRQRLFRAIQSPS